MNIAVRWTVPEDAPKLADIQREAFLPMYEKYKDSDNPCLRGKEDILPRLLLRQRFLYFTILIDDEIAGGILYRRVGNGLFFRELNKGEYYLQRVYVAPGAQRSGVAKESLRQCESILRDANAFFVDFPTDMSSNKKFFESVGFKDTGKRYEVASGMLHAFYKKSV